MAREVRAASRADAPAVRELLAELGYPTSGDLDSRLRRWTSPPERRLLLAVETTDVLGLLALATTPRLESDRWWAQVVALVVSSSVRGQGVGTALVQRAETLSADAGCDAVIINSSRARTDAHAFYKRLGYRDRCGTTRSSSDVPMIATSDSAQSRSGRARGRGLWGGGHGAGVLVGGQAQHGGDTGGAGALEGEQELLEGGYVGGGDVEQGVMVAADGVRGGAAGIHDKPAVLPRRCW